MYSLRRHYPDQVKRSAMSPSQPAFRAPVKVITSLRRSAVLVNDRLP
jgi:hypothetical protein